MSQSPHPLNLPIQIRFPRIDHLVAAQLPGLLNQGNQRRGIGGERPCLGSPLFGDLVEIGLRFRQLGNKVPAQLCQIAPLRVTKYPCGSGFADRQRCIASGASRNHHGAPMYTEG